MFVQAVDRSRTSDISILGASYTFGELIDAQALGDLRAPARRKARLTGITRPDRGRRLAVLRRRRSREIEEFGGRTSHRRQPEGTDCAQVEAIDPSVTSPLCAAKAAKTSSFSRAGTPK